MSVSMITTLRIRLRVAVFATVVLPASLCGSSAFGRGNEVPTVEKLLPPSTLFAAYLNDASEYQKTAASLPMGKIMAEAEVEKFLEKPIAAAKEMAKKLADRVKKEKGFEDFDFSIEKMTAGSYGRCFVALTHITLPDANHSMPDIGFVIGLERRQGAPDWIAMAKELVMRGATSAGASDLKFESVKDGDIEYQALRGGDEAKRPPFLFAEVGGLQLFSLSKNTLFGVLARAHGTEKSNLEANPNWQIARKEIGPNRPDSLQIFANMEALVDFGATGMKMVMAMTHGDTQNSGAIVDKIIDKSGFRALKAMLASFQGVDGVSQTTGFMVVKGERTGLMKMSSCSPINMDQLKWIPDNASSFSIGSVDLTPLYDFAMDALNEVDPEMHTMAVQTLESYGAQVGGAEHPIKLREDLFQNIGPGFMVISPKKASMLGGVPPMLVAMQVRNGDRVVEAMSKMIEFVGNALGQKIKLETEQKKGYTIYSIGLGGELAIIRPAFTVAGDYLYVSTEAGLIKQQMKRLEKGEVTDITANPDYQRFAAKLPKDGIVALSYDDTRYTFESLYDIFISTVPTLTRMADFEVPIDFQNAPMRETISQHLFGSMSFAVNTPNGSRFESYGPFGGEAVGLVLVGALGAGIFVAGQQSDMVMSGNEPVAVSPTRPEASPEDRARDDIRKLSSTVVLYRIETDGLPNSLDDLLKPLANYAHGVWDGGALPKDPWGNAYLYSVSGKEYNIWSAGANGTDEKGSGDDIARTASKN